MSYDTNVYYNPERHGLSVVYEHDFSSGRYEFDIRVVWYHEKTNKYYTARDQGCSCPTPFENYASIHELEEVAKNTDWKFLDGSDYEKRRGW